MTKTTGRKSWLEMLGNSGSLAGAQGKSFRSRADLRCQLPNVDVETGIKNNNFPYKALV